MRNKLMYDSITRKHAQTQEKMLAELSARVVDEKKRTEKRNIFMRDYARILYSSSFRRLQGKMQLLNMDSSKFNRNRLTHSLEVAQIARSVAFDLGLKAPVVAEMASLAHDLGNPPFGHYGEIILNELISDCGGYEGNAQTFRILRHLEKKHYAYNGLNLTIRGLFAVTKYFNKRTEIDRKFLYDDDYQFLSEVLENKNVKIKKSIDAQIMDLADEIAYAAHDLEDALSFKLLDIDEVLHEFKISSEYESAYNALKNIVNAAKGEAMQSKKMGSSEEYAIVLRKELTAEIVNRLCKDIGYTTPLDNEELGYKNLGTLAKGLKKLLFKAICRKKDVQLYEKMGEKIIRGLFEVYSDTNFNKDNKLLPPELRQTESCQKRLVVDYISGMMDSFAIYEYKQFFGQNSLDAYYIGEKS